MIVKAEGLDFRICETDQDGTPRRILALAMSFNVAMPAYEAALTNYPYAAISLLHRARQIKHRPASHRFGGTIQGG